MMNEHVGLNKVRNEIFLGWSYDFHQSGLAIMINCLADKYKKIHATASRDYHDNMLTEA